jgi:membrane fusion protein (multidrug efflux system)
VPKFSPGHGSYQCPRRANRFEFFLVFSRLENATAVDRCPKQSGYPPSASADSFSMSAITEARAPVDLRAVALPANEVKPNEAHKGNAPRRRIAVVIGGFFSAVAAVGGYVYWDHAAHFESTDDAFIAARQFAVGPKVSGYIIAIPVTDNQRVTAGDVIARIDQRDFQIALEQTQAQVASADADIKNIEALITVQQAQLSASQAQVEQIESTLVFARQQAARYQELVSRQAGPVQQAQQMSSTLHEQEAALKKAQASEIANSKQIEALEAQRVGTAAKLTHARAQRDQAQLNLSYTTITAAQDGTVVNLTASVGQFAQVGASLTMFVPYEIWVTANYKETQLEEMRPGQSVIMRVDAYSKHDFRGHVDSIQPGSGTVFSLLPAQNATGNYVKIVQRVPVKLVIDSRPVDITLGPGMSVVPWVRVRLGPSLYERLVGRS